MPSPAAGKSQPVIAAPFARTEMQSVRAPKMPTTVVAVLHIGYWSLYVLLLAMLVIAARMNTAAPRMLFTTMIGLLLIAPNVVAFYVQYFVWTPRLFPQKRFGLLALVSILTALCTSGLSIAVISLVTGRRMPAFRSITDSLAFVAWLAVLALIHMTLAMVIRGFISWYEDIAVKEQLRQKTSEVEGALLRAKLDPHFLFNTLNNIDVLITRDAAAASGFVNQLCDILRYVLYEARADRVPLSAELAYLNKYIALERIRLANPQMVSFSASGEMQGVDIAPMLLIPFVENAFKHAAGQREDNAIAIAISVHQHSLTFVCSNSYQCPPFSKAVERSAPAAAGGLGKALMRQRLELLYPGQHVLAVSDSNNRYSVRLDLTLEARRV